MESTPVTRRSAALWLTGLSAVLLNLALSCPTRGQEIIGVTAFARDSAAEYRFDVPTQAGERTITFWRIPESLWWRQYGDLVVITGPPGRYTIRVDAIVGADFASARPVSAALPVEILGSTPNPPVPPGPGPAPEPEPEPGPNPYFDGIDRILILYESASTTGQEVFRDPMVRDTMTEIVEKVPAGTGLVKPEWRIWDRNLDAANESDDWKAILAWAKQQPEFAEVATKPAAFVFDSQNRGRVFVLPERPEDMIAKLNELEGR